MSETSDQKLDRLSRVESVVRELLYEIGETEFYSTDVLLGRLRQLTVPCAYCRSADDGSCEVAWDEYNIGCDTMDCLRVK